ncbi:hypothetical protein [Chryseobacterium rhizosphaerae]|uniref:DUF4199 domain-containing protein n=1 Tax=Chryseobacterium rhizosphaerae TaxID=395937 RepID=A0ABX9IL85_9FLAO|nr:hypothetical protein [Chryseobacterium rhizosphaerae]REC75539.1 hypothetical protein DRF57_11030 [Chryseobacterium rhizosphaerae]GEN68479.1 hypothetical protein CRH01_30470 [Chryseobacterium rhizosphaerae]
MKEKLNRIILPYSIISITYFMLFSIAYWFQYKYLEIEDKYFGYWLPMTISAIIVWFILRKKLQQLIISEKQYSFTLFITWILLTASIMTSTFYLNRKNGEITYLNYPEEIFIHPATMYYSIKNAKVDKSNYKFSVSKSSVDRGNEIGVGCYYISPLVHKEKINHNANQVWIGLLIGEKFSNRFFDDKNKQEQLINNFIDSSQSQFNKHQFETKFLKRMSIGEIEDYKNGINNTGINTNNSVILREEEGTYENRTGTSLHWAITFLIASNIVWFLLTVFERFKKQMTNNLSK